MSYPKHLFAASVAMLAISMGATATAQDSTSPAAAPPMEPSKTAELLMSNDDQKFMASAASAGMYEVQASQLALQKSDDPKQKAFAQTMIDDHTKAGDELKDLAAKKNVTLPTTLASSDQSMLDKLNKKDAGKDFDKAYRSQMQKSHKKAVSLFDNEARHGKDADVKTWAATTLPKLKHHGGMANALPKVS
jgi:putative membrane protein